MVLSHRSTRVLAILVLLGGLSGCASPPKPATCATIGVVLGGGGGALARQNHHDGDQAMAGAAGAALLGSAGYFLCRAMASDEPEAAPPPPPAPVTPRSAAPAPAPPPSAPVAERIVLRGVNFDFDKAEIRPDAAVILDEAARLLGQGPGVRVQVAGHTDWTGPDAYNQGLSERRAASVRRHLVGLGIDATRLETMGFGESRPIASNETREGRALNRRVELNVLE